MSPLKVQRRKIKGKNIHKIQNKTSIEGINKESSLRRLLKFFKSLVWFII